MQEAFFTSTRRWLLLTGAAALLPAFAGARSRQPPVAGEEVAAPLLAGVWVRAILRFASTVRSTTAFAPSGTGACFAIAAAAPYRRRRASSRPCRAKRSTASCGSVAVASTSSQRSCEPREIEWARVRYMGFEMPGASGRFAERADRLASIGGGSASPQLEVAPQVRVADRAALQRKLNETVAGGGEGLMLHLASAPMLSGRSEVLMKLKPRLDAEAVVVGHRRGTGKYGRQVGAFEVVAPDGRRFLVGSGLTDALRRDPRAGRFVDHLSISRSDPDRPATLASKQISNISVKDGLPASTEADRERAAEQVRALQRTFEKGQVLRRSSGPQESLAAGLGSATKPIRLSPAFCTMPISSATRP
jgi:hypothetical protein